MKKRTNAGTPARAASLAKPGSGGLGTRQKTLEINPSSEKRFYMLFDP